MYTYCFFCVSGRSKYVSAMVEAAYGCRTILPKRIQHTWVKGQMVNRIHDLLPGYVFVYSETPINMYICRQLPDIIRCLRSSEKTYELAGADEAFAYFLLDRKGILGRTQVAEQEGRLELTEASFRGADVSILKVDRRNKRMQVLIRFAKQEIRTWLEYEIIQKQQEQQKQQKQQEEQEEQTEVQDGNTDNGE